jgi:hypothetical protein
MSNFFVDKKTFNERLDICRSCDYYLPLLGNCAVCKCFMRLKCSISKLSCPKDKWQAVASDIGIDKLPQHLVDKVLEVKDQIISQKFKDQKTKKETVEVYNIIYGANYKPGTNCSSCLKDIHNGLMHIIKKYG